MTDQPKRRYVKVLTPQPEPLHECPERARNRRRNRIGICTTCPKPNGGNVQCKECRDRHNAKYGAAYHKAYYHAKRKPGLTDVQK
jgi:hypothetical protein